MGIGMNLKLNFIDWCVGKLMCRFLFRRCDNEPAPWSTEENGDGAWDSELPDEASEEMNTCKEAVIRAAEDPFWKFDTSSQRWGFAKDPPVEYAPTAKKPTAGKSLLVHLQKEKAKARSPPVILFQLMYLSYHPDIYNLKTKKITSQSNSFWEM